MKPTEDGTFLNLKRIATTGGENGPLYDLGVLSVIEQIEKTGKFARNPISGLIALYSTQQKMSGGLLSDDEIKRTEEFLSVRGWTVVQGMDYASGIDTAERLLFHLGRVI